MRLLQQEMRYRQNPPAINPKKETQQLKCNWTVTLFSSPPSHPLSLTLHPISSTNPFSFSFFSPSTHFLFSSWLFFPLSCSHRFTALCFSFIFLLALLFSFSYVQEYPNLEKNENGIGWWSSQLGYYWLECKLLKQLVNGHKKSEINFQSTETNYLSFR